MTTTAEQVKESINAGQPKYRVLADCLRSRIESREFAPGDRLPSFAEMRAEFGVTTTTVERVYSLLEQEGLIERQLRRGLFVAQPQRRLTGNIGVIGTEGVRHNHTYYNLLMRGMEDVALQHGQHVLFLGTDLDWNRQSCEKVDGVLIVGVGQANAIIEKLPPALPRVAVMVNSGKMASVTADDYHGAQLAVQYLLEKGHRRIACLMERDPLLPRRRFAGYRDALSEAGIKCDESMMRRLASPDYSCLPRGTMHNYVSWGKMQMQQWLDEGWSKTRCTALLAQNDYVAMGVMQALQEAEMQVPQHVSVMGFDGTQLCECVYPTLCSVQVPLVEISAKAVEVLNVQIQNQVQDAPSIVFPAHIREGDSVAAI